MLPNGCDVGRHAIPFVLVETVLGVLLVQAHHQPVARHLWGGVEELRRILSTGCSSHHQ